MRKKQNVIIFFFIGICFTINAQYKKYSFQQPKMGSPFNIVIYSTDSVNAEKAAMQGFLLIDTLNEIYSDYLPNSELNRLCAKAGTGEWVKVSEPLFSILQKSYRASESSGETFDVTMSPVIRLWRTARREKKLPNSDSISAAMKRVGYKYIELDAAARQIRLKKPGMQLDLGGIGKGETAQRTYERLRDLGFPFSLIDAGGDVVAGDVPPKVGGWRVSINMPESEELMNQQLLLRNKAVTTSGDLYQYLELNGVRYSHIIDPATGWALTNSRNVTVIAKNGTDADWLTKACSILPVNKAMKLVEKYPSAELQIAILRLFGAKIAPDAQLANITIGAEDLVTIGSDASLSSQVILDNAFVEDGLLKLRSIHLGDHSYVGSSAVIAGDTIIEDYGYLDDMSYLPAGGKIALGEVWAGSPCQFKEKKAMEDLPKPLVVPGKIKTTYKLIFSLMLFVFPLFILIPLLPVIISLHIMDNAAGDYDFSYVVSVPALATLYMFLFGAETVVFTRLLNIGIKPGTYSIYSLRYVRKWLSDQFLSLSLVVMHPIFASVYISRFFRLLGARVGKNTEISTASSVTHALLELGSEAFVADAVTLGEADVRGQQLILEKTTIHDNSFIGNSALIPQGYTLPSNMLIGVLSTPPSKEQLATNEAKDWFGSPAIAMPRRQESNPFDETLTKYPSASRKVSRSIIEFIRIILPETSILCFSIFFIAYGHDLITKYAAWKAVLLVPVYYLFFVGVPALLVPALLKWLLVGRYKPEQKPMWTYQVWRSEAITTTYEALSVPFFLNFLRGTPWLPLAFRILGTKTGKRVYMNTTDITEFDLVDIGTDAALNEDSGPQTHLFEDRVMKTGTIKIGERTSIGARTIVLYDTNIGNDIKISPLSLIMKGEVLAPNTKWTGSPIKPA